MLVPQSKVCTGASKAYVWSFIAPMLFSPSQVCEEQYKVALVGTFYMVGLLFGSFLGSYPADRFGRKAMIFFFVILGGAANLIGGFLSEFWYPRGWPAVASLSLCFFRPKGST